jgi:hypothetical protein
MIPLAAAGVIGNNIKPIIITLGLGAAGYFGYKWYQDSVRDGAQKELGSNEGKQANDLLATLHPYSYKSLSLNPFAALENVKSLADFAVNIDEKKVIEIGKQIKNFDKVKDLYSALAGGRINLVDDIRLMLDATEQKQFYTNMDYAKATGEEVLKDPVYLIANPTGYEATPTYADGYLSKGLFGYKKGINLGRASKLMTVPFKSKTGQITPIKVYLFHGEVGQIKGKFAYVLASQVTTKKITK